MAAHQPRHVHIGPPSRLMADPPLTPSSLLAVSCAVAGIQTYLWQCRKRACPMLSVRAQPPPVVVELLYQINVRLLKQGSQGITGWQPHTPQPVGWRWLLQTCGLSGHRRIADPLQYRQTDKNEAKQVEPPPMTADRRRALYTSDGMTMSSRLLDSLIVQAYVDPLVCETVSALGTTYTHCIAEHDWRAIAAQSVGLREAPISSSGLGGDGGAVDAAHRSFCVELMLLDVPQQLVGRSFGFMQLLMIVQHGWVALGLYRDRRMLATSEPGNSGAEWAGSDLSSHRSPYFVFTNPPPDTCLEQADRIYTVVQRWLDEDTAEAVLGQSEAAQPSREPQHSDGTRPSAAPPLTASSVPLSYSPRSTHQRATPVLPS